MLLDTNLLDRVAQEANDSARLRAGYDLRTSPADGSQRMLNALAPGTRVPIHRHRESAETMIVIRGVVTEMFFDDQGRVTQRFELSAGSDAFGVQIPQGVWHTVEVSRPV